MRETLGNMVYKAVKLSAKVACNSTSLIGLYQPVAPKSLKKKSEKK